MKRREEVEVKIAVTDLCATQASLRRNGFRIHKRRVFEKNLILDDVQSSIKSAGHLLRLRTAGTIATCTFKGKEMTGIHKRREEREFKVDNVAECAAVFGGLGLSPVFTYEKYRTEYVRPSEAGKASSRVVTLDETPIGIFIELEGPARWIDQTARQLGYSREDYIKSGYATLYAEACDKDGTLSNTMRFHKTKPH